METSLTRHRHPRRPSAAARRSAALRRAAGAGAAPEDTGPDEARRAARTPPLAAEDALLVVWVLFGSRLVTMLPAFSSESDLGAGAAGAVAAMMFVEPSLAGFVAIGGALGLGGWLIASSMLFAFWTRGPEDVDLDTAVLRRFLFVGPAFWLLGPLAMLINALRYGAEHLVARLARRPRSGIALHKGWPGPLLPSPVRRLGALPAILGGELAFRTALGGAGERWGLGGGELSAVAFTVIETVPAFLVFVVAPRLATGAVLKVSPWLLRFAVYYAAVLGGDHWVARLLG